MDYENTNLIAFLLTNIVIWFKEIKKTYMIKDFGCIFKKVIVSIGIMSKISKTYKWIDIGTVKIIRKWSQFPKMLSGTKQKNYNEYELL